MIWDENVIYIFLTKTNGVWCIEEIKIIDKEIVTNSDFIIPKSLQIFVVNLRNLFDQLILALNIKGLHGCTIMYQR